MTGSVPWGDANRWLLLAAALCTLGSALHLACIAGGPDWYRAFGAGEPMARMAERGSPIPAILTMGIAAILMIWAAYALSAAGVITRLPLLPLGLMVIAAVLLLRGGLILVPGWWRPDLSAGFKFWSSAYVLAMALPFIVGTFQRWKFL
jgi:hypothetical protein